MATSTRSRMISSLAIVAALQFSPVTATEDGAPDPAFGDAGERLIERIHTSHSSEDTLGDLAVLPSGSFYWAMVDGGGGIWLARLLRNGAWDPTFGNNGLVELNQCVPALRRPVSVAADGTSGVVLWTGACLLRFDPAGSLDPLFAAQAAVPGPDFRAAALLRDHSGRWLLAGTENQRFVVRRYQADGSNDTGFADAGVLMPVLPVAGESQLRALREQDDGRLLLAGWSMIQEAPDQVRKHLVVSRWLPDGSPDTDFGPLGKGLTVIAPPAGYSSVSAEALVVDRQGGLIVVGDGSNSQQSCCALITRLHADGMPDDDFGLRLMQPPGVTVLSPFGETSSWVELLPGRQILIARNSFPFPFAPVNTRTRFTLIRLHADGELDAQFGDSGWKTYVVSDPTGTGMEGAYTQLHRMHYQGASALMFGRTFFEDQNSSGNDFVTLVRARFERLFADAFEH